MAVNIINQFKLQKLFQANLAKRSLTEKNGVEYNKIFDQVFTLLQEKNLQKFNKKWK